MKEKNRIKHSIVSVLLVVAMVASNFSGFSFTTEAATSSSTQSVTKEGPTALATKTWDFESSTQADDFEFYRSGTSSFSVKDGMLVPSGRSGEMKAISNADIQDIKSVSVDIIPGESGLINAALYVGASDAGNSDSQIDALAFLVESNFSGWTDAPKRIDIVTGIFPKWTELQRIISEPGNGNALFSSAEKEPLNLQIDFADDTITVTLRLVGDASKCVQTVIEYNPEDLEGTVGVRAYNSDVCFDNFVIGYDRAVPEKLQQGLEFGGTNQATAQMSEAVGTIPQTIEMWVKVDEDSAAGRNALISSFSGTTQNSANVGDWALFTNGSGQLAWYERSADGYTYQTAGGSSIKTGDWVHVAVTRQSGQFTFYINGEAIATKSHDCVILGTESITIPTLGYCGYGSTDSATYNYLDGAIGDVRLWSTTRTQSDIQEDMFIELVGNEEGLMNYWTLDEQAGTVFWDSTTAGNKGTIDTTGAIWTEGTALNEGLEFSGVNEITAQMSKAVGTIPQTVEVWVKIDEDSAAGRNAIISSFSGTTQNNASIGDWALFTNGTGQLAWYEKSADGNDGRTYQTAGGPSIKTGEWVHVAVARQSGEFTFYINGEEIATKSHDCVVLGTESTTIPTLGYCGYGSTNSTTYNYLDGAIRDIRLWSTTRTEAQIFSDMYSKLNGNETGLMNYWKLDEQSGTTFKDSTSSGNNGTIISGVSWFLDTQTAQEGQEETFENEGYMFSAGTQWQSTKELSISPNAVEAWVKVPEAIDDTTRGVIISAYPDVPNFSMELYTRGRVRLYWTNNIGEATSVIVPNVDIRTGEWMHIAFVIDEVAKTVTFYLNGNALYEKTDIELEPISVGRVYIGRDNRGSNQYRFPGEIADLRVWDKTLTLSEVVQSMSTAYTTPQDGLILNVPMNEVVNNTFEDLSGNNNKIEIYQRILNWMDVETEPGDYSIVIVPDQQILSHYYPDMLNQLYQWIADNAEKENIKMVIGVGDITDDNSVQSWEYSAEALSLIEGVVPYAFIAGNHDYAKNEYRDLSLMNQYFPLSIYESLPTYGGAYEEGDTENTWHEFEVYGHKYLVLALEFGPRDAVLEWASDVVEAHPDHQVIVTTHGYMNYDGKLLSTGRPNAPSKYTTIIGSTEEPANDANQIWDKLVSKHKNIVMVLSGHIFSDNVITRTDYGENGNPIIQMLINGQEVDSDFGGKGLLAIMRFSEDGQNASFNYFSPVSGKYLNECNQFTFTLPPATISEVDKSELGALVDEVGELTEDDYTAISWNTLGEALTEAIAVLDNEEATHKNLEDALETLQAAIDGLEKGVTYFFEDAEEADDFTFYHSTDDTPEIKDGKLIPTGSEGEIKAIVNAGYRAYESVSVDIYPGEDGTINSGIYLGASKAGNADDQINALAILVQSNFVNTDGTWEDAPNRIDLIVTEYPWKELSRTISETGAGNALFTNGVKEPLHLDVDLEGDELTITLSLLSDPNKYVQVVYKYTGDYDLENGKVGLRSSISNNSFDNLNLVFEQLEIPVNKSELEEVLAEAKKVKEDKYTSDSWKSFSEAIKNAEAVIDDADATQDEVDAAVQALENAQKALKLKETYKTATYTFNSLWDTLDFDFYHSSNGGFIVKDGKLTPSGELGEFKAILRGDDRAYQSVSVDIYPGEDGNINSGLYINATGSGHAQDRINALSIMVESNFSGWDDAANRVDLVVGSFPTWKELSRTISETGAGNALFTNGKKEPLNLKVDIDGKVITITVSLLSNPDVFVQTVYEYIGEGELEHGAVGIRSLNVANSFDNFKVVYQTEIHSKDGNADTITNNTGVNTGDNMGTMMLLAVVMLMVSFGTILSVFDKKRKKLMQ